MKWQPLLIALLLVLSQAALFTGCVGLLRRKPLVVRGPGVAVVLVGATVALLGACAWMVLELDGNVAALASLVAAVLFGPLLVRAIHAAESSCLVIGTTRRWVRHALRASFFRMSIPFHDESSEEDIPLANGRYAILGFQRLARYRPVHLIRTHNFQLRCFQADLAREMDEYFAHNAVYTDTAAFGVMTAAGVVLLAADVYVWVLWIAG